jgi:hypothetical protein
MSKFEVIPWAKVQQDWQLVHSYAHAILIRLATTTVLSATFVIRLVTKTLLLPVTLVTSLVTATPVLPVTLVHNWKLLHQYCL